MFKKPKKYKKNKAYTYMFTGIYSSGMYPSVHDKIFVISGTVVLRESLNALEMMNEVIKVGKRSVEIPEETQVFLNSYYVESN